MGILNYEKVDKIFRDCLFEEEEVFNNKPLIEYTTGHTFHPNKNFHFGFSTKMINKHKKEIIDLIDSLSVSSFTKLDDLFFDKDGIQWCNDIKFVDQLLLIGSAAEVINVNEVDGVNFIIREHDKDNETVVGIEPLPLTDEELDEYFRLQELNAKRHEDIIKTNTNLLKNNIDKIAYGFAFFGLSVEINKDNECALDFYDSNNNLICTISFEDMFGINIEDNKNILANSDQFNRYNVSYYYDNYGVNKHIFSLTEPKGNRDGVRFEFLYDKEDNLEHLDIRASYANDPYKLVQFEISDNGIHAMINNQFGHHGNYVDGEHREVKLYESHSNHGPYFYMIEEQWPDEWGESLHSVSGSVAGFDFDLNNVIGELSYKEFDSIAYNLVRHPRNKETIETVLSYIDSKIPGLKRYVQDNFIMYDYIIDNDYVSSPEMDERISRLFLEACNIDALKNRVKK